MATDDGRDLENEQYHLGRDSWFTEGTQRPVEEDHRPARTVHEPARETPVHEETDVLVVGGGPAGCAAAVAAARLGSRVILVERYNHLGGLSTGGLVIWIDRMSDWEGKQIITGFATEVLDRLPAGAVAGAARAMGLAGPRARRALARAPERLSRGRDVVADDRPRVAEARVGRDAPGGRGAAAPAQLGGRRARRWARAAWGDLREQAGPPGDPGQGPRRRQRRPRRVCRGRRPLRVRRRGQGRQRPALRQHRVDVGGHRLQALGGVQAWRARSPSRTREARARGARLPRDAARRLARRRRAVHGPAADRLQRREGRRPHRRGDRVAPAHGRPPRVLPPPRPRLRGCVADAVGAAARGAPHPPAGREAQDGHGRVARGGPPRGRDRRLAVAVEQVRQRLGPLRLHRSGRPRQRPGRRAPRRDRPADPGVHARDPAVLADRAGRGRRGCAVGGHRHPAERDRLRELQRELRGQSVYLQPAGTRAAA
jgi:hypothetical protein